MNAASKNLTDVTRELDMKDPHDIIEKFFRTNRENELKTLPVYPQSDGYIRAGGLAGKDTPKNEILLELFNLSAQQELENAGAIFDGDYESLIQQQTLAKGRWLEEIENFIYEDTLKHIDGAESGISENIMNVYERNKGEVQDQALADLEGWEREFDGQEAGLIGDEFLEKGVPNDPAQKIDAVSGKLVYFVEKNDINQIHNQSLGVRRTYESRLLYMENKQKQNDFNLNRATIKLKKTSQELETIKDETHHLLMRKCGKAYRKDPKDLINDFLKYH